MKNIFYITIIVTGIFLAIAVSSGKLGGISDLEARKRASQSFSR